MTTRDENSYPDCVRHHVEHNSIMFAVTDDSGAVVAVHEVFLDDSANEIGRQTTGTPEIGYVRFFGEGSATIFKGEPEDGMKIWADTGKEVWVDVSGLEDNLPTQH